VARVSSFRGFPPEAVSFLEDLEANNDREWFKANRSRHQEFLVEPALALADDLSEFGSPHIFRPWNDTRFHMRPPIKEHLGMTIGYEGSGGYYVEISLDGLFVGAGLHHPARDQLERIRRAIDTPRQVAALRSAIAAASDAGLSLVQPELTRAPRGYPADHPELDLLRCKSLTVSKRQELRGWVHKPEAGKRVRALVEGAAPLVEWLRSSVGPPQDPSARRR
jgi:uncharacterized protein (TIGR02453 family)